MTATSGRNRGQGRAKRAQKNTRRNNASLLPTLIAGSACGLISGPAAALQLGELDVQSALGQPLRASIAFALSPNEQLFNYCVALKPGTSADGLPMLSKATLSVANGRILLNGSTPLREPMLALQIAVECNYTANLTRNYIVMLDPARPAAVAAANPIAAQTNDSTPAATPESIPVSADAVREDVVVDATPVALSTEYTVRVGDTLSDIAARIEDRPIALWPAVHAIFAANPDAFMNGDINRLKAGSTLTIPSLDNVIAPTLGPSNVVQESAAEPAVTETGTTAAYAGYSPNEFATDSVATNVADEQSFADSFVNKPIPLAGTDDALLAEIQPGDILVGDDASFVSPIESPTESSTDTAIRPEESRQITNVTPVVADRPAPVVASIPSVNSLRRTNDEWSWMFWLAGSGMALILGLLLFGRKIRGRFDSVASVAVDEPTIRDDEDTARNEALTDLEFAVGDTQPDSQDYTLDADLGEGTGLNDNSEISVAQDFGFSTETDLDLELPEVIGQAAASNPTDVLPTQRITDSSILDEEILPGEENTYNLSMIVDATKQNIGDEVSTEKDLKAVPFDMDSTVEEDIEFTMRDKTGIDALQQDYEDELTATQAANLEIEKVAADLALRLGEPSADSTAEMPMSGIDEDSLAEKTAEMPLGDVEEDSLADKTAEISEAIDAGEITSEITAQMPGASRAENEEFSEFDVTGINDELTAQLPASEDDATTEMEVETGHYKTHKSS